MTGKRRTGDIGEALAATFLEQNGYIVLSRNFTVRGGEIDIIAQTERYLVFVEVKLRKDTRFQAPRCAIDEKKKRHLITAAERFLYQKSDDIHICSLQPRFDCIEIILSDTQRPEQAKITHLVNIDLN